MTAVNFVSDQIDFSGFMRAIVLKNDDKTLSGRVGVFIPKLMSVIKNSTKENLEKKVPDPPSVVSPMNGAASVGLMSMTNYLWASPAVNAGITKTGGNEGSFDVPMVGAEVCVFFMDNDPQQLFYLNVALVTQEAAIELDLPSPNAGDAKKLPNIKILKKTSNGNAIGFDTNDDENSFFVYFPDGPMIRIGAKEQVLSLEIDSEHRITIDGKQKFIDISSSDKVTVNCKNAEIIAETSVILDSAAITLKTPDSATWCPNVVAICPMSGLPHGGPGAGVANLKGS